MTSPPIRLSVVETPKKEPEVVRGRVKLRVDSSLLADLHAPDTRKSSPSPSSRSGLRARTPERGATKPGTASPNTSGRTRTLHTLHYIKMAAVYNIDYLIRMQCYVGETCGCQLTRTPHVNGAPQWQEITLQKLLGNGRRNTTWPPNVPDHNVLEQASVDQ